MDMTDATDELVRQVSGIPQELGAGACFGEPVEKNGHTLIPVARVSFGYGLGFGGGTSSSADTNGDDPSKEEGGGGGGGGGGGSATPVAIIDISDRGVSIEAIEDKTRLSMAGIMMVAWNVFWVMLTIRAFIHERGKVRRTEIDRTN